MPFTVSLFPVDSNQTAYRYDNIIHFNMEERDSNGLHVAEIRRAEQSYLHHLSFPADKYHVRITDGAYMPVPRCDACKYLAPDGAGNYGDCTLAGEGPDRQPSRRGDWNAKFGVYSDDPAGLETSADFGCTEWRKKL